MGAYFQDSLAKTVAKRWHHQSGTQRVKVHRPTMTWLPATSSRHSPKCSAISIRHQEGVGGLAPCPGISPGTGEEQGAHHIVTIGSIQAITDAPITGPMTRHSSARAGHPGIALTYFPGHHFRFDSGRAALQSPLAMARHEPTA